MITKVYLPRSLVPLAAVLVRLSDFLAASVILFVLMVYYGRAFTSAMLLVPFLILHLTLLALSLGHGRTVFFVSHDMKAIGDLCGRVLLIRSGRLYEGSNPQNMIAEYFDEVATAEAHHASLLANTYESVALASS